MYYRRKIILSLLQEFGGKLTNIDFQKFLFLVSELQKEKSFDFVPYKYGCYSFQASNDKRILIKYGLLENKEELVKKDNIDYLFGLKDKDKQAIKFVKSSYGHLSGKDLIRIVYKKFPYYSVNSLVANTVLNEVELRDLSLHRPINEETALYTIGYEGKSLEKFLNELYQKDVKVLIDVRKNPVSMKFGFSKNQLEDATEKLNIKYLHLPNLGIDSSKRKSLKSKSDYSNLFIEYSKIVIPSNIDSLKKIDDLIKINKRVAITCFEKDFCDCHRSKVSEAILNLLKPTYEVIHL
jgi:uncharacterized protein (DUF488 family)